MSILYLILPLALVFAAAAVGAFAWTVRSGQLDDVDTPPRRILFDDDECAAIHQVNSVAHGKAPAVALK